ncbi:MAG: ATP-dependent zinc metalloprotease FtsH [Deltaproteobacteria bacterium]|nr:ATP-dependent zinc metalloprotease FtsH [Deltaproteobacteria bacterium]MCX7953376.1 ATP-dependent zinc metalloprotease FtsH [Deltaproteobacteria bacterium]
MNSDTEPQKQGTFFFLLVALLLGLTAFAFYIYKQSTIIDVSYSEFINQLEAGQITEIKIEGQHALWKNKNGKSYSTNVPNESAIVDKAVAKKIEVIVKPPSNQSLWLALFINGLLPVLLIFALFYFLFKQVQIGAGKGFNFGKARAKVGLGSSKRVTFKDVAGVDEAKEELHEIIEFLKEPKKFTRLGGRIPKGVLLIGPPGTGKTLLAKAIAGEANVPFFSISGSDFVEMFVGVGASRVRDLFQQAKKSAPCIIFIDEIDAVGRHRGAGLGGGHDEREQTLNQLLVEMDGFESNEGVIIIAATNRPDVLDPALLRPGRFDRRIVVPRPDFKGRLEILKVHSKKVPLADEVDLEKIAKATPGFCGADLEILVNEAALRAARLNKSKVDNDDFEYAKDKVLMGAERKSLLISEKEKKLTAYHESGHALVAKFVEHADPVHKLTIVPRGMALGLVQQLPAGDRYTYTKSYWLDQLAILFGGRCAEELVFNEVTTGASSDIEKATEIARRMVTEWGMSDKVGLIHLSNKDEHIFLGKELAMPREHSEKMQQLVDEEVAAILTEQYSRAKKILKEHLDILHALSEEVLKKETLDGGEIDEIITKHSKQDENYQTN